MINLTVGDVDFTKFENRTEYVSIVITYIHVHRPEPRRYEFLENCINSIHRHADYPFEIIVVDDSGIDLTSLHVKDKISTLLLNMGKPLKQSIQLNRGINVASSKYIITIEDDIEVTRPCFKDIVNVLDKPYVGFINPEAMNPEEYLMHRDTKFVIGGGLSGAWFNAFRKDVWKEVGGHPDWSHSSNPPFCHKILQHGYWRAFLVGDRLARDVDNEDYHDERSTRLVGLSSHFPRIFNMAEHKYNELSTERHLLSRNNFDHCRKLAGSVSNFDYWRDWRDKLTTDLRRRCISSINWEVAKLHGQDKWKDLILSEKVYYS